MNGQEVALCQVDLAFSLTTLDGTTVRAQGFITYRDIGGAVHEVDPEGDPRSLGPLLEIARSVVSAASAAEDGTLAVVFRSGAVLQVAPDERYESWVLTGRSGFMVVCTPGGEIAVWEGQG